MLLDELRAQGAPTENAKIEVQKIADSYTRVHVTYDAVNQPGVWDQGFAYFEDSTWKAWGFGSGMAQEHVEAAGIPRSVWPDGWLTAAPKETAVLKAPPTHGCSEIASEAVVLDRLPGQEMNRRVWLVHDGWPYTFTFLSVDPSLGAVYTEMEALFTAGVNSFRFLR